MKNFIFLFSFATSSLVSFNLLAEQTAIQSNQQQQEQLENKSFSEAELAQMLAPILVGIYLGKWADKFFLTEKVFAISLTLLGVFIGMFLIIKEVISMSENE